jgi:hypothetical protein
MVICGVLSTKQRRLQVVALLFTFRADSRPAPAARPLLAELDVLQVLLELALVDHRADVGAALRASSTFSFCIFSVSAFTKPVSECPA